MSAITPRKPLFRRLPTHPVAGLWSRRELLVNLARLGLSNRYRNSILGFAWSLLTPLVMMLVFTFVFTRVFRSGVAHFPIFFLTGLLPWRYFSSCVQGSLGIVVANAGLVKKIYFPREVLPLSHVLAESAHFLLTLTVLFGFLIIRGFNFLPFLPLLLATIVLQTIFNAGLAMALSAAYVHFRDLREILQVAFLVGFYATPIVYSVQRVPDPYRAIIRLNPVGWFIDLYRSALYTLTWPSLRIVLATVALSVLSLLAGYEIYSRAAHTFAKEI